MDFEYNSGGLLVYYSEDPVCGKVDLDNILFVPILEDSILFDTLDSDKTFLLDSDSTFQICDYKANRVAL